MNTNVKTFLCGVIVLACCTNLWAIEPTDFDFKAEIGTLSMRSPGSGQGGVFIVSNRTDSVVVKFDQVDPSRGLLADKALALAGVRTANTIAYTKRDSEFNTIQRVVYNLRGTSTRTSSVYDHTVPGANVVLLQSQVIGVEGSENVTALMMRGTSLAAALRDQTKVRSLGALFVTDAFLGNEDRLEKIAMNLNNIMLDATGFVAIDNFSDAPNLEAYMWEKGGEALVGQQPQLPRGRSYISQRMGVSATEKEWFQKVVVDGYTNASTGLFTSSLGRCLDFEAEANRMVGKFQQGTALTSLTANDWSNVKTWLKNGMDEARTRICEACGLSMTIPLSKKFSTSRFKSSRFGTQLSATHKEWKSHNKNIKDEFSIEAFMARAELMHYSKFRPLGEATTAMLREYSTKPESDSVTVYYSNPGGRPNVSKSRPD